MAAAGSPALKHWARIIKQWPVDKVRPESVALQTVMQRRIDRIMNPSRIPQDAKVKGNAALVSADPPVWNEQKEMKQAAALDAILDDKYASMFPMPPPLRRPATNPDHYDNLVKELQEAPKRSWFSSVMTQIRGRIRFS